MLLKEYIENLQKFVVNHPERLELPVIYAADDEGNNYDTVHYAPSIMAMVDGEYQDVTEDGDDEDSLFVCIN